MAHSNQPRNLEKRVVEAAEAALARQQYVSAIDVLCGMRLLLPSHVDSWRKGRVDYLEQVIQGNPSKISSSVQIFHRWAREKKLKPSEAVYACTTRSGTTPLRFSESGDPGIEKHYRTHFVSPALPERKLQKLQEKLQRPPQPVVFQTVKESQCSECGLELPAGEMLFMDAEQTLCLSCAGMGDLEFLGAGDTALTRRTAKYNPRVAVVVRFSRARKRYERQGILAETAALEKAERECLDDAEERAAARLRDAARRREEDRALAVRMAEEIALLFPGCPPRERTAIAEHTAVRGSGRVGRTGGGRNLEERAMTAAVIAAIRHNHTDYDAMLASGLGRQDARQRITDKVEEILTIWRTR